MELESFKITNFRSIKDIKCTLSPKITVLAGKNEAGKTTILQALEALNNNWKFSTSNKPKHYDTNDSFVLECQFRLTKDEVAIISKETDYDIKSNELIVYRENNDPLQFEGSIIKELDDSSDELGSRLVDTLDELVSRLHPLLLLSNLSIMVALPQSFSLNDELVLHIKKQLNSLQQVLSKHPQNVKSPIQLLVDSITTHLDKIQSYINQQKEFEQKLTKMLPKIILFSSFNDLLPSEIQYHEFISKSTLIHKYRIVSDLLKLSQIDVEKFPQLDKQGRANAMNKGSRITSDLFGKHWHQNPIDISYRVDEPSVLFFIQDKGKETLFRPEERSKGLQWYISFFLRLTAEQGEKNIILIDEPGLYLHAKAQSDVLELLEELSENNQIIFSTHSPYLIDPTKLSRVRLVQSDRDGNTEITNFNTKADLETLTPIMTAIGLDITKGFAFPNKKNLVIEGVSDYFYLQGMIHYLKNNEKYQFPDDLIFVPCVGSGNVGSVTSLLHGYGLNYKILLDKKGTAKTKNSLIRDGLFEDRIIRVGSTDNDSIENLFDNKDQKMFGMIDNEKSKTLVSRDFYDRVTSKEKIPLSPKTISKFKELLDDIKKNF